MVAPGGSWRRARALSTVAGRRWVLLSLRRLGGDVVQSRTCIDLLLETITH
jgi:hypothetical protein